jgi:hypothetical protein
MILGLVLALSAGCGEKEAAPVTAAKEFARAMRDGDTKAVIGLLEHDAHARLEQAAARASDQVGGRRNIELHEMLQVVDVPHAFQVAKAELVTSDDTHAQVALTGADGERHSIELVLQDGEWRVRVSVPETTEDAT